jgi:hypothetical protein
VPGPPAQGTLASVFRTDKKEAARLGITVSEYRMRKLAKKNRKNRRGAAGGEP